MKQTFFLFAFFLFALQIKAQVNLVPNPSFELYDSCPKMISQLEYCTDWLNFGESPDYFNKCAPQLPWSWYNSATIPINCVGVQYAATGNAYIGLFAYDTSVPYREYIGCKLLSKLQIGTRYFASFKVNLADSSCAASNKVGIGFSTYLHDLWNPLSPNNKSMVYTHQIITDTTNWISIKGSFIADSAYEYFIMGNLFDDSNTTFSLTHFHSLLLNGAYYFIDDVCLSTDSTFAYNYVYTGEQNIADNHKTIIYPNPVSDNFSIVLSNVAYSIQLLNILGQQIFWEKVEPNIRNYSRDISQLPSGIYLLKIQQPYSTETIKLIKQ